MPFCMAPEHKNGKEYMEDRGKETSAQLRKTILAMASPTEHPKLKWMCTNSDWHSCCTGDSGSVGIIVSDNFGVYFLPITS